MLLGNNFEIKDNVFQCVRRSSLTKRFFYLEAKINRKIKSLGIVGLSVLALAISIIMYYQLQQSGDIKSKFDVFKTVEI